MRATIPLFEEEPCGLDSAPRVEATPARIHRAEILALRSAELRREALARITDPKTRATVRFYVEDHFARLHQRPLPDFARIEAEEIISSRGNA